MATNDELRRVIALVRPNFGPGLPVTDHPGCYFPLNRAVGLRHIDIDDMATAIR
jgi:hypothetical protein